MKKTDWIVLLIIALLGTPDARACELTITSAATEPMVGTKDCITIRFAETCNCITAADETRIKTKGMTVLAEPEWKEIRPGVYEAALEVQYNKSGKASITAERRCDNGGGKKMYEITVK